MTENTSKTCQMCDVKISEERQRVADFAILLESFAILFESSKLEQIRPETENIDLKAKLEWESTEGFPQANREIAIASGDRLAEIRRLKEKVNRLITDRLFPGSINDNDLKREVIE